MTKIFFKPVIACLILCGSFALAEEGTSRTSAPNSNHQLSSGGLFVEPLISVESNDTSIKTSTIPFLSDTHGSIRGAGLGLRLGGHIDEVFFLAADGRYTRTTFDDSSYQKASATGYNYGVSIGAQTPYWGIRILGGYVLGGTYDPSAGAHGVKAKFDEAKGYRVGLGFHISTVAINLEYQDIKYGKSTLQSVGDITNLNLQSDTIDLVQQGTVLSLSFPMQM